MDMIESKVRIFEILIRFEKFRYPPTKGVFD